MKIVYDKYYLLYFAIGIIFYFFNIDFISTIVILAIISIIQYNSNNCEKILTAIFMTAIGWYISYIVDDLIPGVNHISLSK